MAGRRHRVAVRRAGREWVVTLDGRDVRVDAARVGESWSLLLEPAGASEPGGRTALRRSIALALETRGPGELVAHVGGCAVPLVLPHLARAGRPGGAADEAGGPQTVLAPMPGRIVRVLVRPGETVQARQGLVVIEAMKMQNELRAARPGTVVDVRIAEGALVAARAVLVVLR